MDLSERLMAGYPQHGECTHAALSRITIQLGTIVAIVVS
jgi:hypothetical protein